MYWEELDLGVRLPSCEDVVIRLAKGSMKVSFVVPLFSLNRPRELRKRGWIEQAPVIRDHTEREGATNQQLL
jgi:hypothetical protein